MECGCVLRFTSIYTYIYMHIYIYMHMYIIIVYIYIYLYTWGVPKIGLPPNHPFLGTRTLGGTTVCRASAPPKQARKSMRA